MSGGGVVKSQLSPTVRHRSVAPWAARTGRWEPPVNRPPSAAGQPASVGHRSAAAAVGGAGSAAGPPTNGRRVGQRRNARIVMTDERHIRQRCCGERDTATENKRSVCSWSVDAPFPRTAAFCLTWSNDNLRIVYFRRGHSQRFVVHAILKRLCIC